MSYEQSQNDLNPAQAFKCFQEELSPDNPDGIYRKFAFSPRGLEFFLEEALDPDNPIGNVEAMNQRSGRIGSAVIYLNQLSAKGVQVQDIKEYRTARLLSISQPDVGSLLKFNLDLNNYAVGLSLPNFKDRSTVLATSASLMAAQINPDRWNDYPQLQPSLHNNISDFTEATERATAFLKSLAMRLN